MQFEKLLADNHIGAQILDNTESRGWISSIAKGKFSCNSAAGGNRYVGRSLPIELGDPLTGKRNFLQIFKSTKFSEAPESTKT